MSSSELYSLLLPIGVGAVAIILGAWQWVERGRRSSPLSEEDARHFRHQEIRRSIVAAIMAMLAVGIFAGSRVATRVGRRPNLLFVEIWIGIFGLVLILLVLAMMDWLATKRYAVRHRAAILREGIELLKEELRVKAARHAENIEPENRNGHASPTYFGTE